MKTLNKMQDFSSNEDPINKNPIDALFPTLFQYLLILSVIVGSGRFKTDWLLSISVRETIGIGLGLVAVVLILVGISLKLLPNFRLQVLARIDDKTLPLVLIFLYVIGGIMGFLFVRNVFLPILPETDIQDALFALSTLRIEGYHLEIVFDSYPAYSKRIPPAAGIET